uniref:Uncharacterized protein n=1 Tax=Knipowitschia caucasica TaxID=637954 RepID=A0AAV2JRM3_KNICA
MSGLVLSWGVYDSCPDDNYLLKHCTIHQTPAQRGVEWKQEPHADAQRRVCASVRTGDVGKTLPGQVRCSDVPA